jgi:glutathione S-transferase
MVLENCKVTYFGTPGRGESIRLALSIGKISFTDEHVTFSEWGKLKPNTPWGSLPLLTLKDGTVITQQRAILRFVGKETGLYPTGDHVKAAQIDAIMDATEDLFSTTNNAGKGLEQAEMEKAREAAFKEGGAVYNILKKIDGVIGEKGYAVGDTLTVADLFIYGTANCIVSGFWDGVPADALDVFANLTILRKNVRSHVEVCKWYDGLDKSIKLPASYSQL